MIVGIGTDIIQIQRIEKILSLHPTLFLNKYFSPCELQRYENQRENKKIYASKIAKLFAGKEAFVKALGTGFRFGINLHDIEILSNELGKPYINITGETQKYIEKTFQNYKNLRYYISLSDDYPTGTAFVIIEDERDKNE